MPPVWNRGTALFTLISAAVALRFATDTSSPGSTIAASLPAMCSGTLSP
jgi:hypothetical protein